MLPILHRILIDQTQAIGTRDKDGNIALHEAAYFGNLENIRLLLRANQSIINTKNKKHETPLFKACYKKDSDPSRYDPVIKELKKHKAY